MEYKMSVIVKKRPAPGNIQLRRKNEKSMRSRRAWLVEVLILLHEMNKIRNSHEPQPLQKQLQKFQQYNMKYRERNVPMLCSSSLFQNVQNASLYSPQSVLRSLESSIRYEQRETKQGEDGYLFPTTTTTTYALRPSGSQVSRFEVSRKRALKKKIPHRRISFNSEYFSVPQHLPVKKEFSALLLLFIDQRSLLILFRDWRTMSDLLRHAYSYLI